MIILGIDPGVATGWAIYDTDCLAVVDMGQTEDGVLGLADFMRSTREHYDLMVVERFELRENVRYPDLTPKECIGWLKGERYEHELVMPASHKALVKDKNIKQSNLMAGYKIGAGHSRDALRLTLYYAMAKLKHVETIKLVKGMN